MDVVCEVCGAFGYKHLLVQCNNCKNSTRHRGIMKIGQEYISLAAHLSNEACKKVHKLSRSLPPVMKVTMHSKLKAWASRFEASELTAESIGLYFFSDNVRPNKDLDRLVQYVTDHSIVLKYVFGFSKLLIFPSALLPEQCQMFQGKHYLWGVFRRRGTSKVAAQVKQKISASHAAERVKHQDKVQGGMQDQEMPPPKGTMPSENPLSPDTVHDREMPLPNGAMPSLGTVHDIGTETDPGEHRCKVQGGTQDEEMPVSKDTMPSDNPPSPDTVHDQEMPLPKGTMPSENQPVPGTVHDVGTETDPGEHRKSHANSEAPPTRLIGLVVTQTPRAEQFIKDLENEGALVFAVKGLVKPGPVRHQAPSNAVGSQPTRDNRPPASEA